MKIAASFQEGHDQDDTILVLFFIVSSTFSCEFVLASGTADEDSSYSLNDTSAKQPMTEEEKREQVKRSELLWPFIYKYIA